MIAEEILILEDKNGLFERDRKILDYLINEFVNLDSKYSNKELAIDYTNLYLDSNYADEGLFLNQVQKHDFLKRQNSEWSSKLINVLENILFLNQSVKQINDFDIEEIEIIQRVQDILGITKVYEFNLRDELERISKLAFNQLGLSTNHSIYEYDR